MYRIRFHQNSGLQSQLLLLLDVVAHVAQLLLHHANRLKVCRMVEGVASQQQQLKPEKDTGKENREMEAGLDQIRAVKLFFFFPSSLRDRIPL